MRTVPPRLAFIDALKAIASQLIVLHHLSYALRYAQDVMLLHEGRSAYQGPISGLSEHDLSQAYGIKVRLQRIDGQPHVLF